MIDLARRSTHDSIVSMFMLSGLIESMVYMKQAFEEMNQYMQNVSRAYQKTDIMVMMATQYVALIDCMLIAKIDVLSYT